MALFKRQKGGSDIPPELQPYYDGTTNKGSDKGWLRWLIRGVVALVILIILALGVTLIWHAVTKDDKPKSDSSSSISDSDRSNSGGHTSSTSTTQPASGVASTDNSASTNKPATTTPAPAAASTTPTNDQSTNSNQLANTGPTETVTVFIVAAVLAAAVYQYYLRTRRINRGI